MHFSVSSGSAPGANSSTTSQGGPPTNSPSSVGHTTQPSPFSTPNKSLRGLEGSFDPAAPPLTMPPVTANLGPMAAGASPHHPSGGRGRSGSFGNSDVKQAPAPHRGPTIEVHDSQLRAPLSVPLDAISPTLGLDTAVQAMNSTQRQRHVARLCDNFYSYGTCPNAVGCPELHVQRETWDQLHHEMTRWIAEKEELFTKVDPGNTFRVYCADIKEIIDVPANALSFTRGLYLDPASRAKRSHQTHHQSPFAVLASQVPTACGLFSVNPSQCKWGRWCNQAHIDGQWMRQRRAEFEDWSMQLEAQFQQLPDDHLFNLHDPETKIQLSVSKSLIAEFSRGLFQGSHNKAPSICMLYQRGRCTAGPCCNQVHVTPSTLMQLRTMAAMEGRHMKHPGSGQRSGAAMFAAAAGAPLFTPPGNTSFGQLKETFIAPPYATQCVDTSTPSSTAVEPSPKPGAHRGIHGKHHNPGGPSLRPIGVLSSEDSLSPKFLNPSAVPFVPPPVPPNEPGLAGDQPTLGSTPPHPADISNSSIASSNASIPGSSQKPAPVVPAPLTALDGSLNTTVSSALSAPSPPAQRSSSEDFLRHMLNPSGSSEWVALEEGVFTPQKKREQHPPGSPPNPSKKMAAGNRIQSPVREIFAAEANSMSPNQQCRIALSGMLWPGQQSGSQNQSPAKKTSGLPTHGSSDVLFSSQDELLSSPIAGSGVHPEAISRLLQAQQAASGSPGKLSSTGASGSQPGSHNALKPSSSWEEGIEDVLGAGFAVDLMAK